MELTTSLLLLGSSVVISSISFASKKPSFFAALHSFNFLMLGGVAIKTPVSLRQRFGVLDDSFDDGLLEMGKGGVAFITVCFKRCFRCRIALEVAVLSFWAIFFFFLDDDGGVRRTNGNNKQDVKRGKD